MSKFPYRQCSYSLVESFIHRIKNWRIKGAASVIAIDHDPWSIKNAAENCKKNKCRKTKLLLQSQITGKKKYDVILANISRNVILENLQGINSHLNPHGILVISGFLKEDEDEMIISLENHQLKKAKKLVRDNWLCISLEK